MKKMPGESLGFVDHAKRIIDITVADLVDIIDARLAAFLETRPKPVEDGLLDRAAAAKFLRVSLSKLDLVCRADTDRVPFVRIGARVGFARGNKLFSMALR